MFAKRVIYVCALALLGLSAGGCATVLEGTSQVITVNTGAVADVDCTLSSPAFGSRTMKAPGAVTIEKSKHDVNVHCTKEGYEDGKAAITSHFAAATAANIVFGLSGIVIGGVIDAASGASNKYDAEVAIVMTPKPEPPLQPGRARRVPAPAIVAPAAAAPAGMPIASPAPPATEAKAPPPPCREVGGYEDYKKKTGEVCRL